jgi:hypothetical protein
MTVLTQFRVGSSGLGVGDKSRYEHCRAFRNPAHSLFRQGRCGTRSLPSRAASGACDLRPGR